MSFAICSAGEIIILAVMVGILKGLKSDESTENNTKAFSVLIAFSGGVWRKPKHSLVLTGGFNSRLSSLRSTMVLLREASSRSQSASWNKSLDCGLQTDLCGFQGMLATEADILVLTVLLPHVSSTTINLRSALINFCFRGDVLNTTVFVSISRHPGSQFIFFDL